MTLYSNIPNKTMKADISITKSKKGTEIILSSKKINKYGIIAAILFISLMLILFQWLHGTETSHIPLVTLFLTVFAGAMASLLLHKLFFGIFSPNGFRSISYIKHRGHIRTCHCNEPIRMWQYRTACFLPFFLLGGLPLLYGMISGNYGFAKFGTLLCAISFDDIYILWKLRSFSKDSFISDRSEELNFHVW